VQIAIKSYGGGHEDKVICGWGTGEGRGVVAGSDALAEAQRTPQYLGGTMSGSDEEKDSRKTGGGKKKGRGANVDWV